MPTPIVYRKASPSTVNYSWTDFANSTGYVSFYLGDDVDSTYFMSNNVFYSDDLYTQGLTALAGYQKVIDIDFDVLINRPLTLQGQAIVEVPVAMQSAAGMGRAYATVKIRKWDGASDTELGNNDTVAVNDNSGAWIYWNSTLLITIPKTSFAIGEYLRVTVEGYADNDSAANTTMRIAHDPAARSADYTAGTALTWSASYSSRLLFQCPVRIPNL